MLDRVTLDQLRTLIAAAEGGSFSAAGRRLSRVQSAVSTSMSNLEAELGVAIWDRSTRAPTLTPEGEAVLAAARRVCAEVDELHRLSAGFAAGMEASVSLCVEQLMPVSALVALCRAFAAELPDVELRVDTQTLTAVSARVLSGAATLGVVGPAGVVRGLEAQPLADVELVTVVAPRHPLASRPRRVTRARLAEHVQLVLSERDVPGVPDQAVLSPRTWRVADLHTKHALLRAGLGWGNLPSHLVREDLRRGRLVRLRPEAWRDGEHTLRLFAVHRADQPLGPAHRWVVDALARLCARATLGR